MFYPKKGIFPHKQTELYILNETKKIMDKSVTAMFKKSLSQFISYATAPRASFKNIYVCRNIFNSLW